MPVISGDELTSFKGYKLDARRFKKERDALEKELVQFRGLRKELIEAMASFNDEDFDAAAAILTRRGLWGSVSE